MKEVDTSWAQSKIADVSSEVFRTLVVKRGAKPEEAAEALAAIMNHSVFEMLLMRAKLAGVVRPSMTVKEALLDESVHETISEAIIDSEIRSLQGSHSRWIWTGWISKRRRPL